MRLGWLRPFVALTTAAVFFLPLYIALVNVFKPSVEIVGSPLALPLSPTLDNIAGVLTRPDGLFWWGLLTTVTRHREFDHHHHAARRDAGALPGPLGLRLGRGCCCHDADRPDDSAGGDPGAD